MASMEASAGHHHLVLCLIWASATVYVGLIWSALYSTFITHGQSQESILEIIYGTPTGKVDSQRRVLNAVALTMVALSSSLAELVNIWRCWELYSRRWTIVIIPFLAVICGLTTYGTALSSWYRASSPIFFAPGQQIILTIEYCVLTAATNITTTSFVIGRIVAVGGWRQIRTYSGLVEIMIESSFLYSATYIVYLALYVHSMSHGGTSYVYVGALLSGVTAAAPTMIMARIMSGRVRPDDSWTRSSTMQSDTSLMSSLDAVYVTNTSQGFLQPAPC
ncbi:hypothetical protein BDZ89DRAFT_1146965 [Hymenopellis radicata]|nr:hypothetical protein BDZ89DRAFT_1146965 [Hymenopellis radicata]